MRPIQQTITLAAADPNGITTAETPGLNADLTLNGAFVSGGIATLTPPRSVTLTSADDFSAVTFTIYGYDENNYPAIEALTGPNNATVTSTTNFKTVTRIATDSGGGFTTETVEAGAEASGIGDGAWWPLDLYNPNQVTTISVNILTGTANYSVQYTNEDPFDTTITQLAVAHPVAALTGASTDQTAFTTTLMRAVRVNFASGTGTVRVTVTQQSTV